MPAGRGARRSSPRRREAGYNFVVLIVAVTVLNVLLAAALPLWSSQIRREKEEELIARGLQYAEAVRVFMQRFGRPPTRLDELLKVEPRSIRRLWEDPMTEGGEWGILAQPPEQGSRPVKVPPPPPGEGGRRPAVTVAPIAGVYSLSGEESIKTFFGKERYDQWEFHHQIFTAAAGFSGTGFGVPGGSHLPPSIWVVARPYRQGLAPAFAAGAGDQPGTAGQPDGGPGFGAPAAPPQLGRPGPPGGPADRPPGGEGPADDGLG